VAFPNPAGTLQIWVPTEIQLNCRFPAARVHCLASLTNMKIISRLVLIATLLFITACNPSPNPALTGTWMFTLTPADNPLLVIQAQADLTELGNNVTGTVTLSGTTFSCGNNATMSGVVKGNALTLELTQEQSSVTLTGQANQAFTSASGTYSAATGPCLENMGSGNWSAVLQ